MESAPSSFSQRTEWILRVAGVVIPVLLVVYGLIVRQGFVDNSHYAGDATFIVLMSLWGIVAVIQSIKPPKNNIVEFIQLASYHIFAGAFILLVAGFTTAFVAAWVMLMFTAYSYFRQTGLVLSTSVLVFVGIIDSIRYLQDPREIISIGLSVLATVTVGLAIVSISRTQEVDNTELTRTKALESLQRDRILTLINNLADAILSTDRDGIIRVYNAASLNLLNTNSSLDGQSIEDVLPLRDKNKKAIKLFRDLKKSHSVVMRDDLTLTQEGETIRLELTYSPIRSSFSRSKKSEKQDGYILILRDITKAKSLEEERDEFISVVSHELRTPLSIAEGTISNVQVMLDRGSIAKSVLKSGVQAAHDQMIFLSKMVNDLSTLSRAERGAADAPEVIAIRDLVDDLYKEYAPQAEKKGLRFDLDLSPELGTITASPLYLKEMIQNFITNSIKYTKEGGVTLRVMRKDNDITFDVRDTGIGISKSDQPRVFTKFFRSEDYRTRETGGTGLGLYVSAKLAKKLDTHITLVSRLNHGSSFSFTLTDKENKPAIR
jgi:PAS domain S-box-containing protein